MRYEVIDYYQSQGYEIPLIIERGSQHQWRVTQQQVEAACEYIYLQIQQGAPPIPRIDLGRHTLTKAKQLRIGHYYKVNRGDPVLLDDLTAIRTLQSNLIEANNEIYALRCAAVGIFVLFMTIIINIIWLS